MRDTYYLLLYEHFGDNLLAGYDSLLSSIVHDGLLLCVGDAGFYFHIRIDVFRDAKLVYRRLIK